jgi:hypothetical protein
LVSLPSLCSSFTAFFVTAAPEVDAGSRHFGMNGEGTVYEATTAFVMPPTGAPNGATPVH